MRRALALGGLCGVACLGLAGCAGAARWEKPGADEAATSADMAACRSAARDEAFRYTWPSASPFFGPRYWFMRPDTDRFVTESNLTRFCMQNKGYALVPIDKPADKPVEKKDGER
jgi:hypothetical protein